MALILALSELASGGNIGFGYWHQRKLTDHSANANAQHPKQFVARPVQSSRRLNLSETAFPDYDASIGIG